jgi:hypothetical protein
LPFSISPQAAHNAIHRFRFGLSPLQPSIKTALSLKDFMHRESPSFEAPAFHRPPSKAGRGVAFLKLARAKRGRWEVLGEFAKYAFFWPEKEAPGF